jgi:Amt family ammonium transporter
MLRPMDTVARFGGDEFTLLFEDLDGEREVVLVAERISRAARVPIRLEDNEVTITVSIGIAMVDDPSVPPDTVIREADAAMYRAKERGRSRYELFDEASKMRATKRLELEAELRHAVENSELRVHYQPRFALNGEKKMTGFEALVRWEHPERGLIAPAEFIPLAEETGIVIPIGEYVLDSALRELAGWQIAQPDLTISVNLSPRQLEDTGLASMLTSALRTAGLEPAALCLEITESALGHNPEVAIRTLQALKAVGVRIAIDDYGTGAASLESLKRMPIDMLKLHESFVSGLNGNPGAASIAGAVIELAHALGLSVVAEGVETDLQLGELRSLGCDAAQGFFLCQPVSGERASAIVAGE